MRWVAFREISNVWHCHCLRTYRLVLTFPGVGNVFAHIALSHHSLALAMSSYMPPCLGLLLFFVGSVMSTVTVCAQVVCVATLASIIVVQQCDFVVCLRAWGCAPVAPPCVAAQR